MSYCIRPDYTHRLDNELSDERDKLDECQDDVYAAAKKLAVMRGYESVMDIGTGGGYKLLKHFGEFHTLGLDVEPNVSWLKEKYPDRQWAEIPFTQTAPTLDLIICADVIEHLVNPDELLDFIKRCQPKEVVISTPNRDNLQEWSWAGPPRNTCHVREWSASEFRHYITESGFEISEHIYPDPSRRDHSTMWVVAKVKDPVLLTQTLGKEAQDE